jgi:magnesium transporter
VATQNEIYKLADSIHEDPDSLDISEVLNLKRKVFQLQMLSEEINYIIRILRNVEVKGVKITDQEVPFHNFIDGLEHVIRSLNGLENRIEQIHQHYLLILQDKTSNRLRVLTILSAVFMPLTLIAGIYGMNFQLMPELKWAYAYPVVLVAMFMVGIGMVWFFYWRGWFN